MAEVCGHLITMRDGTTRTVVAKSFDWRRNSDLVEFHNAEGVTCLVIAADMVLSIEPAPKAPA